MWIRKSRRSAIWLCLCLLVVMLLSSLSVYATPNEQVEQLILFGQPHQ